MKILLKIALCCTCFPALLNAQTTSSLQLDSTRTFSYLANGDSILNSLTTFTYPKAGTTITTNFSRQTATGRMQPSSRFTRVMTGDQRLLSTENETYNINLGRFMVAGRTLYYPNLNAANRLDSTVFFLGNTTTGIISRSALLYDYSYDANNNNSSYRLLDYGAPTPNQRHQFSENEYDNNNRLLNNVTSVGPSQNRLTLFARNTYAYAGDTIRLSSFVYDTLRRTWAPDIYSFPRMDIVTANRRTTVTYRWNATAQRWDQSSFSQIDYDALRRITTTYASSANSRSVYSYRGDEKEIRMVVQYGVDPNTGASTLRSRTYYYYTQSVSVRPALATQVDLTVAPNPASTDMLIEVGDRTIKAASLTDMCGRVLHITNGIHEKTLRLERGTWPAGVYLLQLQLDDHSVASKQVVWQ